MNWTIPRVIESAGGLKPVAEACELSVDAIRKWPLIGIPDRHWTRLIELSCQAFGPDDLYRANRIVRQPDREAV